MIKKINTTQRICPKCKGYFRHKGTYCSHRCERLSQPKIKKISSLSRSFDTKESLIWRQYWSYIFSGHTPIGKEYLVIRCKHILKTQKFENNKS